MSYRAEAGQFASPPLGWILHVVVGNGSPYDTFSTAKSPNRRFSHAWVAKDGHAEQYQTLDCKSWAQVGGNGTYWSIETEGYPTEPLTDAQIATLARFHVFLGAAKGLAEKPGDKGIGTHYMGGSAWGGHSCPDPTPGAGPRSHQRAAILAAAYPPPAAYLPFPLSAGKYFGRGGVTTDPGKNVERIQYRVGAAVDGVYGTVTDARVRFWQKSHGLAVDGFVGPRTWAAMKFVK